MTKFHANIYRMKIFLSCFCFVIIAFACTTKGKENKSPSTSLLLDSASRRSVEHALDGFEIMPGYQLRLFASEPMLQNPTNIDVDHKGRVYVCEAYNYRPQFSGVKTKFEGDRIVILEDTNGDGKADVSKVFYQGPEINAPLGICVLGNVVLVSQSPYIWKFTDTDGDDKADKKEILFQGIKGIQDDHGVHALTLGPDGKFYFSMGNASKTIFDSENKIIKTITGEPIDESHFRQGLILRGNLNGSGFEVLGQNFRNNYECAVDAFGNIWQTDNDDDGNRGTRLNYILEYGKYGYKDEITNADWRAFRANIEDSIPLRHWHQNDPGVVPNLLNLGSGSPCGLMMYEGDLIKELKGTLLHAEALHHVIRSYKISEANETLQASISEVIRQKEDDWFRPVDVTAAPDGSLFIADWYDPGVGGHYAGDQVKGRIYRLAPSSSTYSISSFDEKNTNQLGKALASPNLSTRSLAQLTLRSLGKEALPLLQEALHAENQEWKSRALWIASSSNPSYIDTALLDKNESIKKAGLRMARQAGNTTITHALDILLSHEQGANIWQECAIALKNLDKKSLAKYWQLFASKYTAGNRWFLEALGIAGDGNWDILLPEYLKQFPDPMVSDAAKDIIWRSRSKYSLPYLVELINSHVGKEKLRYLRSMDFINDAGKNKSLLALLHNADDSSFTSVLIKSLDPVQIQRDKNATSKVLSWMKKLSDEPYLDLVEKFYPKEESERIASLMLNSENGSIKTRASKALIKINSFEKIKTIYSKSDDKTKISLINTLGGVQSTESLHFLRSISLESDSKNIITEAYRNMGKGWNGEEYVLNLFNQDSIPKEYLTAAMQGPLNAWRRPIKAKAMEILNYSEKPATSYNINSLINRSGNQTNGQIIFSKTCTTCHKIGQEGIEFGPSLEDIGSKYGKEGLYTSIIEPSKAINFGYEGEQITTNNGGMYVGIKENETTDLITLKMVGGQKENIDKKNIKERIQLKQSLMTPYLYQSMTEQELVDLVEYLSNLKKTM